MRYTDVMPPERISIEMCWRVISGHLFKDKPVSEIQHNEMQRAFYLGFTECFKIMNDLSQTLSVEHAALILTKISGEAIDFHRAEMEKFKNKPKEAH